MHTGLCHDHSGEGMPNEDRRTILSRQHALGRGYRFRQRCQWVLHGCGIEPRCLQSCNPLGPACPVGEQPVHKDNVSGLWRGLHSGGVALEKSACRTRSHHVHECASIHWIPWTKIVLAVHGSSPLRKVGVGYWEHFSSSVAPPIATSAEPARRSVRRSSLSISVLHCDWLQSL